MPPAFDYSTSALPPFSPARASAVETGRARAPFLDRIGEAALRKGLLSPAQIDEAFTHKPSSSGRFAELLTVLSPPNAASICECVAATVGADFVRPDQYEIVPEVLPALTPRIASHYSVIPLRREGGRLVLASAAPESVETMDELELLLGTPVVFVLALPSHIRDAIKKHYGVGADTIDEMRSQNDGLVDLESLGLHSVQDDSGDASIIRFVNQILLDAHRLSATDIHFEPEREAFRIRYRVDGLLEEIPVPPRLKEYQRAIVSRIKVMARLDIAEQRLPQDGRIPVRIADEAFDLRVSVLPTPLGEAVDLRLLRRANVHLSLSDLGYSDKHLVQLEEAARRPNGIILVTGPTGSGKTTSLYALLQKINTPDRKIVTIEDPIEYNLGGIVQMQVHEDIGFTFARALRSILRHDPDIVLVGEIRDPETAEIAIRMAMTGHLVFSTLHTNDAASSIARLIDMGVEPYLLATTIVCVVAQRLIRLICPHCRTPFKPESASLEPFRRTGVSMPAEFFHGGGCEACRKSGYRGRTGIHELFPIDDDYGELIMARAPASRLRNLAERKGIPLMRENGWQKVVDGLTTTNEILRVTQAVEA